MMAKTKEEKTRRSPVKMRVLVKCIFPLTEVLYWRKQ